MEFCTHLQFNSARITSEAYNTRQVIAVPPYSPTRRTHHFLHHLLRHIRTYGRTGTSTVADAISIIRWLTCHWNKKINWLYRYTLAHTAQNHFHHVRSLNQLFFSCACAAYFGRVEAWFCVCIEFFHRNCLLTRATFDAIGLRRLRRERIFSACGEPLTLFIPD